MQNLHNMTVREIALERPVTTRVFEEYKIDYCCHGDTQFDEACRQAGADPQTVEEKIDNVLISGRTASADTYSSMSQTELVEYIIDKHHVYTRQEITHLTPLMAKVASRHGDHLPVLNELKGLFEEVAIDLEPHMMKEEAVLFPYIQQLEYSVSNGRTAAFPPFGTVAHPVRMMSVEHEQVGDLLAKMRAITNDYELPDWACPSFTALYHRLQSFELDLHQHIHLENNLLFPRAIELEQKAFGATIG